MISARYFVVPAALVLATVVPTQVSWDLAPNPNGDFVTQHMVYDSARQRMVLVGNLPLVPTGERLWVWEWDGSTWFRPELPLAASPPGRTDFALAYDEQRQRVVLFGGYTNSPRSDTWEWDGSSWSSVSPVVRPSARRSHAMTYDSARQTVVLFGGRNDTGFFDDTWEYDGTTWTQRTTATVPQGRSDQRLAYDTVRQRTVMFGGLSLGLSQLQDTWEYDGTDWTNVPTVTEPSARQSYGMAYDSARQETVLFGGFDGTTGLFNDTWSWNGSTWTQQGPVERPSPRAEAVMAYDASRQCMTLFGGFSLALTRLADTWEWDGSGWDPVVQWPIGLVHSAAAYDTARQRMVVFGGGGNDTTTATVQDHTWEWDGTSWDRKTPPVSPAPRQSHAMVYDDARGVVVLYGGEDANGDMLADTWEWDGASWTQHTPVLAPPARRQHAMAYDQARGVTVLFGGRRASGIRYNDTWTWDGTSWTEQAPTNRPSPRRDHAMAYDAARQQVVLFGGLNGPAETWTWNGTNWQLRNVPTPPLARIEHAMTWDPIRQVVVLHAGQGTVLNALRLDTFEWDGAFWVERVLPSNPRGRKGHTLVYDTAMERVVMFGGTKDRNTGLATNDVWFYAPDQPATYIEFGTGCGGPSGVPHLSALPGERPWIWGDFTVQVTNLPAGQPAFLGFGVSNTNWGPTPLPFNLGFLGVPACNLLVSYDAVAGLAPVAGTATFTLSGILPAALGGVYYNQAGSIGPGGVVFSNGACATIGEK